MSFEGYYQILCKNGHLHETDVYGEMWEELPWTCRICGEGKAWEHLVDTTNDEGNPIKLEILKPEITKTCNECGRVDVEEPTIYRIPNGK